MNILFVDDEKMVLNGLRRMLHPMRKVWNMHFAESGHEALHVMDGVPVDVIVTDMRMPGMNGVELLEKVHETNPRVIRIVLSGHSDDEMILASVKVAHQFLVKPCDAETLKATVDRAVSLRQLLERDDLRCLIAGVKTLPSLPSLYQEIVNEVAAVDGTLAHVGEIVSRDIGMASKILQLVNSSFFGLRRHVESPAEAATLLGFDVIRSLVLTSHLFSQFDQASLPLDLESLWHHCQETSLLARSIAEAESNDKKICDYAFMGGMLHDIGRVILAAYLPEQYAQVLDKAEKEQIPLWQAEQAVFACTHGEVGAYLLGLWGLSAPIVEMAAFHHRPSLSPGTTFSPLTAVHVANVLLHQRKQGWGDERAIDKEYLQRIGLHQRMPVWQELSDKVLTDRDRG